MSAVKQKQRKALDPRIVSAQWLKEHLMPEQALIGNGVLQHRRSFFVIIGSAKEQQRQVVNLHYLLSQARLSTNTVSNANSKAASRPTVLWTYKKELGFTSNRKKREAKIKRDVSRGIRDEGDMDPFELFVGVTDIRYTYYKETEKILGQTFGMLVLQDFEAITPNLLARTIETVEGGGLVVLLLQSMTSLKQLYTMSMDVHARYRTESSGAPIARFNERFILSLGSCSDCLVVDDELNVLPLSQAKDIKALDPSTSQRKPSAHEDELSALKTSLADTKLVGNVLKETRTLDQAKAVLTFTEAITAKTLSSTVALTAARGRGKSAALGLSIALAVAHSYSNIFVTSPSPENLKTVFEFIFKGFDKLGYEEHLDYDAMQSSNPDWQGAVVRVNIFRDHRQTIQYIQPQDAHVLGQAELVVIDEAAAIPLPLVRNLIGPYLVFMASTVNGYEGTGRSLSLKLIQQLREHSSGKSSVNKESDVVRSSKRSASGNAGLLNGSSKASVARSLKEIKLEEPIRYGAGDKIESWLNKLLCLDASVAPIKNTAQGCPHPSECELFYVDRDTLFSFHPASELFLQRMMALYVASHYKNSPNDLQLMSDAPSHALFALLPPVKDDDTSLPDPLVVLQIALEGQISKQSVLNSLSRGIQAAGDLIPWTMAQQYQDDQFATLSGARIVRIAVHPDYAKGVYKMGYGTRALELLNDYYNGQLFSVDEGAPKSPSETFKQASQIQSGDLHSEVIKVRDPAKMPPLLHRLSERAPESLDYIGVSFGLTPNLFRFWKRSNFVPLYLRQTTNELTGEHSCIMLKTLARSKAEATWLADFTDDFGRRFAALLSYNFRTLPAATALNILDSLKGSSKARVTNLSGNDITQSFSPYDIKRLKSYANNMVDYHVVLDLLPVLGSWYFEQKFPEDCKLSAVQSSLLVAIGLQRKAVEDFEAETSLAVSQTLALLVKIIRKLLKTLEEGLSVEVEASLQPATSTINPLQTADEPAPSPAEQDDSNRIEFESVSTPPSTLAKSIVSMPAKAVVATETDEMNRKQKRKADKLDAKHKHKKHRQK